MDKTELAGLRTSSALADMLYNLVYGDPECETLLGRLHMVARELPSDSNLRDLIIQAINEIDYLMAEVSQYHAATDGQYDSFHEMEVTSDKEVY